MERLETQLDQRHEQIKLHQQQDQDAQAINAEGLKLARERKTEEALEKFRRAIEVPHNHDYALNAAQIILGTEDLKHQPELFTRPVTTSMD